MTATIGIVLVAVAKPLARSERLSVPRDRDVTADRLHERLTVKNVQQDNRAAAGTRQPDTAVRPGADPQGERIGIQPALALNVPDGQVIETQISSSQRTTIGTCSISGATLNSIRTSR